MTESAPDLPVLYVNDTEAAKVLGRSIHWFRRNVDNLETATQFPKKDIAIGLRHLPSIMAWAAERNSRAVQPKHERSRGNKDGF